MAKPVYRIDQVSRWPRQCKGCGERMWQPGRWAHRRCAVTLQRMPQCGAVGKAIGNSVLICALRTNHGGWHEDPSGARWIYTEESADG